MHHLKPGFARKVGEILNHGKHAKKNSMGYYREVFFFEYCKEQYVLKRDISVSRIKSNHHGRGGCKDEAACWEKFKDQPIGTILAPVLLSGRKKAKKEDGYLYWLVMPRYEILWELFPAYNAYKKIIEDELTPLVKKYDPKAEYNGDRVNSEILGDDLHYQNWGRDANGIWRIVDYSEGGN